MTATTTTDARSAPRSSAERGAAANPPAPRGARGPAHTAAELLRRFGEMRAARAPWEGHWQDLADHVLPRRGDIAHPPVPGEKRPLGLFDATAIEANELLAAGLHAMLTGPATPWFELRPRDPALARDHAARAWADEAARRMHAALNGSNFQTEIHELYLDLGCFGTAAMFIEADAGRLVRFSARPLREIFIAQDGEGRIDTVFRRFAFTARQAVARWGADAAGPRIARRLHEAPDAEIPFLHAVLPRADAAPGRRDGANMPFASVYVELEGPRIVSEGGFAELPYVVPRWSKAAGEAFGRSPAMKALADIRMLNEMCKTTLRAAQKVVDPPLLVADDGVVLPVRTAPASLNYARFLADGTDPVRPLKTSADVGLGLQMEEGRRAAIRSAFFVDQLQLAGAPQMTATEVLQRTEEKLRLLGPMLGRLQAELLRPLLGRVYGIMVRAGALPAPPPSLAGAPIEVSYVSPIARAQRATEAQGLLRLIEIAAPLARFQPELADNIDGDAALRHLWGLFAVPPSLLRPEGTVARIRAARADAAGEETAKDDLERLAAGIGKLGMGARGTNGGGADGA